MQKKFRKSASSAVLVTAERSSLFACARRKEKEMLTFILVGPQVKKKMKEGLCQVLLVRAPDKKICFFLQPGALEPMIYAKRG